MAFDRYVTHLEDSHPRQRTRLSQQTWLKVTTDPLLQEVQERQGRISSVANSYTQVNCYHFIAKHSHQC